MSNPLYEYFINNSDRQIHKWVDYFEAYHQLFDRFRGKKVKVLEIGVQNGGSARMWKWYFGDQCEVVGVDVDPRCKELEGEGIDIWIGDQEDPEFWQKFLERHSQLDIIIDDGGHTMRQQIISFEQLFPALANDGIYLCEDCHTSYYPSFGGGLRRPGTFIEYVKDLVDKVHGFHHLPLDEVRHSAFLTKNILSISIYDSVVAIHKRLRNAPIALARGHLSHINNPPFLSFLDIRRGQGIPD